MGGLSMMDIMPICINFEGIKNLKFKDGVLGIENEDD